jgi:hypothetical protein
MPHPGGHVYGQYWVIDADRNWIVGGEPCGWTLDDVEMWLAQAD